MRWYGQERPVEQKRPIKRPRKRPIRRPRKQTQTCLTNITTWIMKYTAAHAMKPTCETYKERPIKRPIKRPRAQTQTCLTNRDHNDTAAHAMIQQERPIKHTNTQDIEKNLNTWKPPIKETYEHTKTPITQLHTEDIKKVLATLYLRHGVFCVNHQSWWLTQNTSRDCGLPQNTYNKNKTPPLSKRLIDTQTSIKETYEYKMHTKEIETRWWHVSCHVVCLLSHLPYQRDSWIQDAHKRHRDKTMARRLSHVMSFVFCLMSWHKRHKDKTHIWDLKTWE